MTQMYIGHILILCWNYGTPSANGSDLAVSVFAFPERTRESNPYGPLSRYIQLVKYGMVRNTFISGNTDNRPARVRGDQEKGVYE